MSVPVVASYARVSSEQQAEARTIESQVQALRERIRADGIPADTATEFVDDGFSGATLVRPALERLRDAAAVGGIDRLYVHSPDRLARKYAYQVLLIDEFRQAGVEVVFLNRDIGETPEDALLLQAQGMVAEYERAKIHERSRRGKLHAARRGSVSVLGAAPYGYRYVREPDGARAFQIVAEEARHVREMFEGVAHERATLAEVARRLDAARVPTVQGGARWNPSTVHVILRNPAYKGLAAFGRTRRGPRLARLRPPRGKPAQPRDSSSLYRTAPDTWIGIPVPALVSADLFEAVQAQLEENARRARARRATPSRFLLGGLVVCRGCGYALCGRSTYVAGQCRYAYYRCSGTNGSRFGGQPVCTSKEVRAHELEDVVWSEVCEILTHPQRIEEEHRRRRTAATQGDDVLTPIQTRIDKMRRGLSRLIDGYAEGLIEKTEFEPRLKSLRDRIAHAEDEAKALTDEASQAQELRLVRARLEDFAKDVTQGLDSVGREEQRGIIRALVKEIGVDGDAVEIVFRVGTVPSVRAAAG